MSKSEKEGPALSGTVQEVQGWFPGNAALQAAIAALALARYDRSDFSLPGERAVAWQDRWARVPRNPSGAFDRPPGPGRT